MNDVNPFQPATRIFGVGARAAPIVVLFRRGPSKHVLALTWNTLTHEFRAGQWLKGRIYEHRCDLSPSGDKLIYLAANYRGEPGSWTAVSRPPFLTALVMWRNMGTWGGGGMFESERAIALNKGGSIAPEPGFRLPRGMRVRPIASWAGRGEDDPIRETRMRRDGWMLADEGEHTEPRWKERVVWEFTRPQAWRKTRGAITLERRLFGIHAREGSWYLYEHRLLDAEDNVVVDFGSSDWADWSLSGELLLAREGRVYRQPVSARGAPGALEELIDLRPLRFEAVPPPSEATTWHQWVEGRRIR